MKQVEVETEIVIARPRLVVAEYTANPVHAPEWYVNIRSAEWEGPAELRIGARIAFRAEFLGRKLSYTYEIADWEPGVRMIMRTANGPFPMETTYTWSDADEGHTHMHLRNAGKPSGMMSLMAPMMAKAMKKANEKDLAMLKEILESR